MLAPDFREVSQIFLGFFQRDSGIDLFQVGDYERSVKHMSCQNHLDQAVYVLYYYIIILKLHGGHECCIVQTEEHLSQPWRLKYILGLAFDQTDLEYNISCAKGKRKGCAIVHRNTQHLGSALAAASEKKKG